MDEITRDLERLPLRPVPATLDARMKLLFEGAKRNERHVPEFPSRRMSHMLAYAACVATGFAVGLFYAQRPAVRRPEVVYVYPVETAVRASSPFDWTQGGAPTLPPWDGQVRVDIRLNDGLPPKVPRKSRDVPKVDVPSNVAPQSI
jgi:hypothetical protein